MARLPCLSAAKPSEGVAWLRLLCLSIPKPSEWAGKTVIKATVP